MKYEVKVPFLVNVYVEVEGDTEKDAIDAANAEAYTWDYRQFLENLNFTAEYELQHKGTKVEGIVEKD